MSWMRSCEPAAAKTTANRQTPQWNRMLGGEAMGTGCHLGYLDLGGTRAGAEVAALAPTHLEV